MTAQLSDAVRTTLDALLVVGPDETPSAFDRLKTEPSTPGVKHLQEEVATLQTLRAIGVPAEACATVPFKVLQILKRRATNERAGEMRAHPDPIRYALMACSIHVRTMEVTDDVVRMLLEIIRRIETQTEKHLHKALLQDITRVTGDDQRDAYYGLLPQPVEVASFIDPLRERLTRALTQFDRDLPRNPYVRLSAPAAHEDRRLLAVARLTAQPEPQSLDRIKDLISQRYGLLDPLDLFMEADRLTGFTPLFTHSGTKEVRSREALRPLLLPDLFGIRNAELAQLRLTDVDLQTCQVRIARGKGQKDRYVLFPTSFRGELAQYMARQRTQGTTYLVESNRCRPYSTRRIRQLVKRYALAAGIAKRVYPHLFRHQLMTYLTKRGIMSPKLQLLSGHTTEQSLAVYRELALSDVAEEYEAAMRSFPVR
jgi:integrase